MVENDGNYTSTATNGPPRIPVHALPPPHRFSATYNKQTAEARKQEPLENSGHCSSKIMLNWDATRIQRGGGCGVSVSGSYASDGSSHLHLAAKIPRLIRLSSPEPVGRTNSAGLDAEVSTRSEKGIEGVIHTSRLNSNEKGYYPEQSIQDGDQHGDDWGSPGWSAMAKWGLERWSGDGRGDGQEGIGSGSGVPKEMQQHKMEQIQQQRRRAERETGAPRATPPDAEVLEVRVPEHFTWSVST